MGYPLEKSAFFLKKYGFGKGFKHLGIPKHSKVFQHGYGFLKWNRGKAGWLLWMRYFSETEVLSWRLKKHLGVSENSVALNPMVNDHYPY